MRDVCNEMIKGLICVVICALLAAGMICVPVNAMEYGGSQDEEVMYNRGIYSYGTRLTISSDLARASTDIVNYDSNIIGIVCVMTLQKYQNGSWVSVEIWRKTSSGESLYVSGSKSVNHGRYRVKSRITVYKQDSSETLETYSETVTY